MIGARLRRIALAAVLLASVILAVVSSLAFRPSGAPRSGLLTELDLTAVTMERRLAAVRPLVISIVGEGEIPAVRVRVEDGPFGSSCSGCQDSMACYCDEERSIVVRPKVLKESLLSAQAAGLADAVLDAILAHELTHAIDTTRARGARALRVGELTAVGRLIDGMLMEGHAQGVAKAYSEILGREDAFAALERMVLQRGLGKDDFDKQTGEDVQGLSAVRPRLLYVDGKTCVDRILAAGGESLFREMLLREWASLDAFETAMARLNDREFSVTSAPATKLFGIVRGAIGDIATRGSGLRALPARLVMHQCVSTIQTSELARLIGSFEFGHTLSLGRGSALAVLSFSNAPAAQRFVALALGNKVRLCVGTDGLEAHLWGRGGMPIGFDSLLVRGAQEGRSERMELAGCIKSVVIWISVNEMFPVSSRHDGQILEFLRDRVMAIVASEGGELRGDSPVLAYSCRRDDRSQVVGLSPWLESFGSQLCLKSTRCPEYSVFWSGVDGLRPDSWSVRGQVTGDGDSSGVAVYLCDEQSLLVGQDIGIPCGLTNEKGEFAFSTTLAGRGVAFVGDKRLRFASGMSILEKGVSVGVAQKVNLCSIRVLDWNDKPVPEAKATIQLVSPAPGAAPMDVMVITDAGGRGAIRYLASMRVAAVSVASPEGRSDLLDLHSTRIEGHSEEIVLSLSRGRSLTGLVRASHGLSPRDRLVVELSGPGGYFDMAPVAESGRFTVERLPYVEVRARVRMSDDFSQTKPAVAVPPDVSTVVIEFDDR